MKEERKREEKGERKYGNREDVGGIANRKEGTPERTDLPK